jgi:hypothetical protein
MTPIYESVCKDLGFRPSPRTNIFKEFLFGNYYATPMLDPDKIVIISGV